MKSHVLIITLILCDCFALSSGVLGVFDLTLAIRAHTYLLSSDVILCLVRSGVWTIASL